MVKNPPANAGDVRDAGSIPESERSRGGRTWQPTPVFLPGDHMDRGAWPATVCLVTQIRTQLQQLSTEHILAFK